MYGRCIGKCPVYPSTYIYLSSSHTWAPVGMARKMLHRVADTVSCIMLHTITKLPCSSTGFLQDTHHKRLVKSESICSSIFKIIWCKIKKLVADALPCKVKTNRNKKDVLTKNPTLLSTSSPMSLTLPTRNRKASCVITHQVTGQDSISSAASMENGRSAMTGKKRRNIGWCSKMGSDCMLSWKGLPVRVRLLYSGRWDEKWRLTGEWRCDWLETRNCHPLDATK